MIRYLLVLCLCQCWWFVSVKANNYNCDPQCINGNCEGGRCVCPPEFTGVFCESECPVPGYLDLTNVQHITSFLNLTISCDPNEVTANMSECEISEMIGSDSVLLTNPDDPVLVTSVARPECLPIVDGDVMMLRASHGVCGAPVQVTSEKFVYEYAIATARNLTAVTLIYRPRFKIFLRFSCEIRRQQTVSLAAAVVPYYRSVSVGVASARGNIYLTAGFVGSNTTEVVNEIITVSVADTITIAFQVDGDIQGEHIVQPTSCYATPTRDIADTFRHQLISEGCVVDDGASVTTSHEKTYLNFHAFVWSQLPSPQSILVTCNLSVCARDSCSQMCSGQSAEMLVSNQALTFGAISVNAGQCQNAGCDYRCTINVNGTVTCTCPDGEELHENGYSCSVPLLPYSSATMYWWIYLIIFGVLLLLAAVAVIVFMFRRQRQKRTSRLESTISAQSPRRSVPVYRNPYFTNQDT